MPNNLFTGGSTGSEGAAGTFRVVCVLPCPLCRACFDAHASIHFPCDACFTFSLTFSLCFSDAEAVRKASMILVERLKPVLVSPLAACGPAVLRALARWPS
jgi:hypothetical protein